MFLSLDMRTYKINEFRNTCKFFFVLNNLVFSLKKIIFLKKIGPLISWSGGSRSARPRGRRH